MEDRIDEVKDNDLRLSEYELEVAGFFCDCIILRPSWFFEEY